VIDPSAEMAKARAIRRGGWRALWRSGLAGTVPAGRWRSNSGDSSIVERAIHTLAASAAPTGTGCASPSFVEVGLAHRG
jgi:hypothetical protein